MKSTNRWTNQDEGGVNHPLNKSLLQTGQNEVRVTRLRKEHRSERGHAESTSIRIDPHYLKVRKMLVSTNLRMSTLQRQYTENSKQLFPEMKLRGSSPNSCIHISVRDLYIPTIGLPILLQGTDLGNI
jgi:hypothetical protein